MKKPLPHEYPEYYSHYINLVSLANGVKALENQIVEIQEFISRIPSEKEDYRYAEGKWTVKEVLGHICDVERIFGYRALCIARGESASLPGFDDNDYVVEANFGQRSMYDLAHEFSLVRESNIALFKGFSSEILDRMGTANNQKMSVRALMFFVAGHEKHHISVLKSKYQV